MALFPSEEWMAEFCRRLAADPRAPQVAAGLDGTYRFVVEPGGPVSSAHRFDIVIGLQDGAPQIKPVPEQADGVRVTLAAAYPVWRQLISGQVDVMMAVMMGRIRASGDVAGLMGQMTAVQPLVDALREVETEWPT